MNIFGRKGLRFFLSAARIYINDKNKTKDLIEKVDKKKKGNRHLVEGVISQVQLLVEALKAWMSGEYKQISKKSLLMIIAGLLYFVAPIDIVPDFLLAIGFVDDIAVISFVINTLNTELQRFKKWKEELESPKTLDDID
jgi:uncharacterized membrane protein YkvA (DUF1232 family)